ncbi:4-aminobutyrate--2-oxoglutarate transaminase [Pollutimonas subterranea]|uniref:4-aminobutyrate--2-oxoglutarate transaminase n=1 Tax=Pollutimonas subterranea TaxID=2045210 RepID=A0A2N4U6C8_9BURK|nr:4-aminobutyrate--2-oxoglutarate transaminase [Pollutimonas subterranea]PLC50553.1 4-aminobutyrate--2-oxoglutarate transaminase [Pollutimonas subterranea]
MVLQQRSSRPGPQCQSYLEQRNAYVARGVANGPPIFAKSASGAVVIDLDGYEYLDFAGGIGTLNVGHSHPEVIKAVKAQADAYLHTCFNIVMYPGYIDLCRELSQIVPGDWEKKTMLQSSGAEAVENAIKIARRATGRSAVIAFENAFHGRTYMALALTAKAPAYKTGFGPLAGEVYRAPFPVMRDGDDPTQVSDDAFAEFRRLVETEIGCDSVAAVIIEPIQGEGGFYAAPREFLQAMRAYCTEKRIVMIADEIQSGFCRTGEWFATQHSGVQADLYTLAKSMGGGMPIAAVVGRADLIDAPDVGGLGGTYAGNPLSCAAALATIRIMNRDDYPEKAHVLGAILKNRFERWTKDFSIVREARGVGAMRAVEIVENNATQEPGTALTAEIVARAYQDGLILVKAGFYGNVLRFLGPLCMSVEQLETGLDILENAIAHVSNQTQKEEVAV